MMWNVLAVFVCAVFNSDAAAEDDGTPKLHILTQLNPFEYGERKVIYCEAININDTIEWYSPENLLIGRHSKSRSRVYVEPKSSINITVLMIEDAEKKDNGTWTCKAGNLTETIDLVIGQKAKNFTPSNIYRETPEFLDVTLHCEATGYPIPSIKWYRRQFPQPITDKTNPAKYRLRNKVDSVDLTIKNITYQDADIYVCHVEQKELLHFVEQNVTLIVQHRPVPEFKLKEEYAIINETKNLTCKATAYPLPKYEWFRRINNYDKRKVEIEDKDTIYTAEDGTYSVLEIRMYNISYIGEYLCTVSNENGIEDVIFHVSIGNKPDPPSNIILINATSESLTFEVTCSSCIIDLDSSESPDPRNLTIIGYSFELLPVNAEYEGFYWENATERTVNIEPDSDPYFLVDGLGKDTNYNVRVRTINMAGYSDWLTLNNTFHTTAKGIKHVTYVELIYFLVFTVTWIMN